MKIREDILRAVSQLEIRARRNITSLLAGSYRSAFRGSGMQFKEFRHYEPGDDIRHMAWNATARTGRATIKVYEEERELDIVLFVDVSGSSRFAMSQNRKVDMYAELVALLGLAAVRSSDNVGLILFDDKPRHYLPARRTRHHVLSMLTRLLEQPLSQRRSDLKETLTYAHRVLRHRSLVLILSDFLMPEFDRELALMAHRHEVILLHCANDAERGQGLKGVYDVCDPETGEFFLLDGNSRATRRTLAELQTNLTNRLEAAATRTRSDYLYLSQQDDYLQRLIHFFRRRGPSRL